MSVCAILLPSLGCSVDVCNSCPGYTVRLVATSSGQHPMLLCSTHVQTALQNSQSAGGCTHAVAGSAATPCMSSSAKPGQHMTGKRYAMSYTALCSAWHYTTNECMQPPYCAAELLRSAQLAGSKLQNAGHAGISHENINCITGTFGEAGWQAGVPHVIKHTLFLGMNQHNCGPPSSPTLVKQANTCGNQQQWASAPGCSCHPTLRFLVHVKTE